MPKIGMERCNMGILESKVSQVIEHTQLISATCYSISFLKKIVQVVYAEAAFRGGDLTLLKEAIEDRRQVSHSERMHNNQIQRCTTIIVVASSISKALQATNDFTEWKLATCSIRYAINDVCCFVCRIGLMPTWLGSIHVAFMFPLKVPRFSDAYMYYVPYLVVRYRNSGFGNILRSH